MQRWFAQTKTGGGESMRVSRGRASANRWWSIMQPPPPFFWSADHDHKGTETVWGRRSCRLRNVGNGRFSCLLGWHSRRSYWTNCHHPRGPGRLYVARYISSWLGWTQGANDQNAPIKSLARSTF